MTKLIKTNLLKLKELVLNQKESKIDIERYQSTNGRGGCLLISDAATDPYFTDKGMTFNSNNCQEVCNLFGDNSFTILFASYNYGNVQSKLNMDIISSYKQLAIARINCQLAQY